MHRIATTLFSFLVYFLLLLFCFHLYDLTCVVRHNKKRMLLYLQQSIISGSQ